MRIFTLAERQVEETLSTVALLVGKCQQGLRRIGAGCQDEYQWNATVGIREGGYQIKRWCFRILRA